MDSAQHQKARKRKLKHRFYVPAGRFQHPAEGHPMATLDADATHHLRNVLRLSAGASVILFDNSGQEYEGEIIESKPSQVKVQVLRVATPRVESSLRITLAQALLKGNAFDHLLTLCTELGCARFIPLFTGRTVVKINKAEAADRVKRWEKIVQEAAAQTGRVKVPLMEMPLDFKEQIERKPSGLKIILWERGGSGQLKEILEEGPVESITLLAGPEGGFEQAEVKQAMDAGYKIWGLGPRILRAENAGAIALSLLEYQLGDMG